MDNAIHRSIVWLLALQLLALFGLTYMCHMCSVETGHEGADIGLALSFLGTYYSSFVNAGISSVLCLVVLFSNRGAGRKSVRCASLIVLVLHAIILGLVVKLGN